MHQTSVEKISRKNEKIKSERDKNELEFPELGQWKITNMAKSVIFDGAKFIDNESLIKGSVELFSNSKFLFDTYCELESDSPNNYVIFAFLIFILHRYADYRLMGHNISQPISEKTIRANV